MARATSIPPELRGFTFVKLLGSGGFSDVFLYEQELPRRKVAVKVLLAEGLTAADREAFVAEANAMAQLSAHPYIVSIHHADVAADGRPFLVMEYCSGPNLADRYKADALPVPEVLRTGIRVASAVATAHHAGLLHRDIKPANILTNDFGWPALTDFGIASAISDSVPMHTMTHTAIVTGGGGTSNSRSVGMSVPWAPPEMFAEVPVPSVRTDVFSLAATIYTLLAGRTPFEIAGGRNQTLDLINRIERGAITPLERRDAPPGLVAALRRGMAVDPAERFESAVELARALQAVELSLSYAPTAIDVPNLVVAAPETATQGGADETRARGVTSIQAQRPTAPPPRPRTGEGYAAVPAPPPPPPPGPPPGESTGPTGPEGTGQAPRRRNKAALLATLGVVVGAGVAAALLLGDPPADVRAGIGETDAPGTTTLPVAADIAPAPVLDAVTTSADGTEVTFSWTNQDERDGDSFIWQRTDPGAETDRFPARDPHVTVTDVGPDASVCIEVFLRRADGVLSADSMTACHP